MTRQFARPSRLGATRWRALDNRGVSLQATVADIWVLESFPSLTPADPFCCTEMVDELSASWERQLRMC